MVVGRVDGTFRASARSVAFVIRVQNKQTLLFTTQRSGSTPIFILLAEYFRQTSAATGLGEFFSTSVGSYDLVNGKINALRHFDIDSGVLRPYIHGNRKTMTGVRLQRYEMLEKAEGNYFFKFFSDQLLSTHEKWLQEKYTWLFLERKNLFEQCLSYLIMSLTKEYYRQNEKRLKPGIFKARKADFDYFAGLIWNYQLYKLKVKPKQIIYYEDFCTLHRTDFLSGIGLDTKVDLSQIKVTVPPEGPEKQELFTNLKEIKLWYQKSFLNNLSPL